MPNAEFRYMTTAVYQPSYSISNAVGNGTSITYTSTNSFVVGDYVTITGVSPSQYNKTNYKITARTSTSFTIASGSSGTYVSGGSATTPNKVLSELPFTGVSFTQQLNSVGTFQGHVLLSGVNSNSLNVYDGTIPGKTMLWVLYTDTYGNMTPVWSGVIWARDYDSKAQTLSVSAQEIMSLFNRRRISTTKDYSVNPSDSNGYDPTYIAYQLMQYAEGLSHGKTGLQYNYTTSSLRTKKIYNDYELKSVYQAIKDLAQNYFDFKVSPMIDNNGSLFNYFMLGVPLGQPYSTTSLIAPVFQFPGNLISYSFPEDASGAVNKLYGLGYGANNSRIGAKVIDTTKIGTSGDWPLLEDTVNFADVGDVKLLQDLTKGQLSATSYPPTTIQIVIPPYIDPIFPSYSIGDYVRLDIQDSYFPTGISFGANGDPLRIVAISVNPGENGPSEITLTLTRNLSTGAQVV